MHVLVHNRKTCLLVVFNSASGIVAFSGEVVFSGAGVVFSGGKVVFHSGEVVSCGGQLVWPCCEGGDFVSVLATFVILISEEGRGTMLMDF